MDISLRLPLNPAGEQPAERTAEVDGFLTTLTKEQTVFLAAIADAAARLDSDSGQVAQVASLQRRLTQQFLDAQRSIIKRRADTDAAVAHIAKVTDVEAKSSSPQLAPKPPGWAWTSRISGLRTWAVPPSRSLLMRALKTALTPVPNPVLRRRATT